MNKKLIRGYYMLVGIVVLLFGIIFLASCLSSSSVPPISNAPEEKGKLSELSAEECLEFITSRGIKIPVALNDGETVGEFVKELVIRAEKIPNIPRPIAARAPIYLAESIRKAVNEHYGIECDNYNIEWESSFSLSFEERIKGQQILSELPEDECIEFLASNGVSIHRYLENDYLGEFIKEIIARIEQYPYAPSPYSEIDALYFSENIRQAVCEYNDIYDKRPPLSELSEEESLEFVVSCGIAIPPALEGGNIGEVVSAMINRADEFYFYPLPDDGSDESALYKNILSAVIAYYDVSAEKPRLSELSGAECLNFASKHGIEVISLLRGNYMEAFVRSLIAKAEGHPYARSPYLEFDVFEIFSESIRKVVNEYYGVYENPKLSEMSEEESIELIISSGMIVPGSMKDDHHLGEWVKESIIYAEESSWVGGPNLSNIESVYLNEIVRKAVNEYYGIHHDNYRIEWRPEFEPGYYEKRSS